VTDSKEKYSLSENLSYRLLPNGKVRAFNSQTRAMFEVDEWAAIVWDCLKKEKTISELKKSLMKIDPEISDRDLSKALPLFLKNCLDLDFIQSLPDEKK
jgi:hypothetical protein